MQRIAIIGAGAVGCGLGFLLNRAGREVTLVGRAAQVEAIRTDRLRVEGYAGEQTVKIPAGRVDRMKTSWPLLGSTLQSLRRKRSTEIDYLNGEVVELGKKTGIPTPLNAKIVELVHQVERTGTFFKVDEVRRKFLYLEQVGT